MTGEAFSRPPLEHRHAELEGLGAREIASLVQVLLRLDVSQGAGPHPTSPPTAANTWTEDGGREWLWLGPDEWLVVGDPNGEPGGVAAIVEDLEVRLGEIHHSIVDVSAARAVIELSAEDRLAMLSTGCALDLHPRSWRHGMCAQTLLARIPVILQEGEGATRVFVRPSFAGYLVDWLLDAAGARA